MFSTTNRHSGAWRHARAALTLRGAAPLLVALVLILAWAAPAHAQDAFAGQYGSPTASGEAAISSHAASPDTEGSAPGTLQAEAPSSAAAQGSVPGEGRSGSWGSSEITVLPETGGPALPLIALGFLALGATSLVALRGRDGGREV